MANMLGLLVFALIVAGFVALFFYLNLQQRVEIDAAFAGERGWQFEDLLPQFGRAQRQHILRGRSDTGTEWEVIISLQQATTMAVPVASTMWNTQQVRSANGLVLIGPQLDKSFDTLDLSHPLVKMGLKMMLGDTAEQIPDLQRVPMPGQDALTVLAVDGTYAQTIVTSTILDSYGMWMQRYGGKELVPICVLRDTSLQIKVQKALTKAADVDAFVRFCCDIAALMKS